MRKRLTILLTILFICVGIYAFAGPETSGGGGLSNTQNAELLKLDSSAVDGLLGTKNSLAYKVHEIEKHFHNAEMWYGRDPGDTYYNPTSLVEWQVTSGADGTYGTALQVSNGDEVESGDPTKYYDFHELLITATNAASKVQKIQVLYGTGASGDATVGTEAAFFLPAAGKSTAVPLIMPRITCNNKVWVKSTSETNGATIDFIVGLHTYDG